MKIKTSISIDQHHIEILKSKNTNVSQLVDELLIKWFEGENLSETDVLEKKLREVENKRRLIVFEEKQLKEKLKELREEEVLEKAKKGKMFLEHPDQVL